MKKNVINFIAIALIFSFSISCSSQDQQVNDEYISAINEWHQKRVAALKEEDSWLSLAGLYQLHEGLQTLGSNASNDIIFPPTAPANIGAIVFKEHTFTLNVHPGATVTHNGSPVQQLVLRSDDRGDATVVKSSSFTWYIIKRRANYYIRLKNAKHPNFTSFSSIERFPTTKRWRVKADFKPFDKPKLISIPDALGEVFQDTLYGVLKFQIGDKKLTLAPLGNPEKDDELFIVLGDKTNGESTYGGGRYLYVGAPDKEGITFIDFNKAYNPPCVFTEFATCPLPPPQNRLPVEITAGEKMYNDF